jgi:hypothetical protein
MKVEIVIPESLSEITLGQYQKYLKIEEQNNDQMFLQSKLIEIFCNVPLNLVLEMKLADSNAITQHLVELLQEQPQLVRTFKMNGKEYGYIPNLEDMSLGEYIDLDTHISDWDNMHLAMNVLYRPIENKYGNRYSIKKYETSDSLHLKDMPLDAAISSVVFFYRLGMDLSENILNSLKEKQESNLVHYLNSESSGDGINRSMPYLMEMLKGLKISLN